MTTYRVVTTAHREGWKRFGQAGVQSFLDHWDARISLTIYTEGYEAPSHPRITSLDVHDDTQPAGWLSAFKLRHSDAELGKGKPKPRDRWRAVAWAHDVVISVDACKRGGADIIIQLNADVITHSTVTPEWLDSLMQPGSGLGLLKRLPVSGADYPECGFVAFDLRHPCLMHVLDLWVEQYTTDAIFQLDGWTDAHALLRAIDIHHRHDHRHRCTRPLTFSLSGGFETHPHPFINGPLGAKMDHRKGSKRKELGASFEGDVKGKRVEPYWKDIARKAQEAALRKAQEKSE